jgi:outer membrane protein OmpA-like peptidoglycan-associated protein
MQKRIKSYKEFLESSKVNEGIVDWVKEKFSKIGEYFNKLKGEALVSIAASIIPKELLDYIRLQAGVSVSESLMILEEIKHMGMGLGSNDDILSPEELDALSDEEYNDYLQKISDNIVFQTDIKGDVPEQDKELYEFLVSKGIEVNKEIVYEHKKSVDNIYRKIESLNINKYAKKALKFAAMVVLFGMVVYKGGGQAYGAELHSDFDGGEKYFADTHGDSNLDDDGGGDHVDKDKKEDPRTLWDKITGKRVVTSHKKLTGHQFDMAAKRSKMDREEYLKKLDHDGWKLTKFESDTLHDTILKQKADTLITIDTMAFGIDSDLFLTGKFDINPNVKNAILAEIGTISEKGGIITNYVIESSTDKEPIQMTNQVLAQNRADAVKDLLVGIGVDDSLVHVTTKPEQGPDVYSKNMTTVERNNARLQTQEYRYVLVNIMYYKEGDIKPIPEIKEVITKIKSVYEFEKESIVKPPHLKDFPKAKTTKTMKNGGGKSNITKCETFDHRGWLKKIFGKKPFWLEKDLGYK